MGTNYARRHVPTKPPATAAQAAHRQLYAQLQGLGSLWLADLIKPYFRGDQTRQCAYRQFIKYNWPLWDKQVPAWKAALPFWGYKSTPVMEVAADSVSGAVTADLFPPLYMSAADCSPRFFQVLGANLNWVEITNYQTLPDRYRAVLPDAAGYLLGSWNFLAWHTVPGKADPLSNPVRG
jgi:hypothetical protein